VSLAQSEKAPKGFDLDKNDNRIILCAAALKESGRQVFFVSKDINARVKSTALGVKAVDYEKEKVVFSQFDYFIFNILKNLSLINCRWL